MKAEVVRVSFEQLKQFLQLPEEAEISFVAMAQYGFEEVDVHVKNTGYEIFPGEAITVRRLP